MASPQKFAATLRSISPCVLKNVERRVYLSPISPIREACKKSIENKNQLSPVNIDTPNRRKILRDGLPSKHGAFLGSGGFGTVYKASYKGKQGRQVRDVRFVFNRITKTGRGKSCNVKGYEQRDQVAAKVMQTEKCSTVLNSEKHASFLRHSNIVKVLMIEQGASLSLITMELCGTTLQDHLDEAAFAKNERIRILKDVTCALQFCHGAGIVHADVKPKNILMSTDGKPKLTDFGSCVLIGEPSQVEQMHGTPGYVAPEVIKGSKPSPAADIYSLGVVSWQMLSRKLPYFGLHSHAILYLSAKGHRPENGDLDDGFNGAYKSLYRKMWSQNAADRPATKEVINEIDIFAAQISMFNCNSSPR